MMLTTERLLLRDFEADDWRAVLAYQSDPRYLRYYAWEERIEAEVRDFVQRFIAQQQEVPRLKFQFAIVLQEEGALIGNCGIRRSSPAAWEAEIGYELAADHWGKGYATEAARAVLDFGFTELNLHRITAHCIAENLGSARVLERIGMQQEGTLREKEWMKGRWWDVLLYAILEQEWQALHS